MKVLLVSTYELGHQPAAVAGPAGQLQARGHEVRCLDLSIEMWDPTLGDWADKVAFSVPMHTAARLARQVAPTIDGPVACYGLYAAMCDDVATALVSRDPEVALLRWIEHDPTLNLEATPPPVTCCHRSSSTRGSSRRAKSTLSRRWKPPAGARTGAGSARSRWCTTVASGSTTSTRSWPTSRNRWPWAPAT